MIIRIDSREKNNDKVVAAFDASSVKHFVCKCHVGDYVNIDNEHLVVERKKDIREIATNVTTKLATFKAELERLYDIEGEMVIVISQDKINGRKIESLEDVMLWEPKRGQGTVNGMTVYRKLASLRNEYPITDIQFCSKANAGKRIIEILGGNNV